MDEMEGNGAETTRKTPVLIYDGDCGFCRYWVGRWAHLTGDSVAYRSSQEAGGDYEGIQPEDYRRAVQFVGASGAVWSGAEAVFRALAYAPRRRWLHRAYREVPGFAPITEGVYRVVADHRGAASWASRVLWGTQFEPSRYYGARWIFLRNLGLIFAVAFLSLYLQIDGLIGHNGILPAGDFLNFVESRLDIERYWRFPTVFWIDASDTALHAACLAGVAVSLLLTVGILPRVMIALAWALYLSLLTVGQDFLSFQWDILLLEVGFLAIFLAPWRVLPGVLKEARPSLTILVLFWWLLFRLMFASGLVKLSDPTWTTLAALDFHYETQPIPNVLGWYAHHLPGWFQEVSVFCMFAIELVVVFLIFFPRRLRHLGAILLIFLQVLIAATGNFCFFNWLTIGLCVLLFDDQALRSFLPARVSERLPRVDLPRRNRQREAVIVIAVASVVLLLSGTIMSRRFAPSIPVPDAAMTLYSKLSPFHLVNGYGLFAHMTTSRPEIVVEGSDDGETWAAYEFKWKPGDLTRRPRQVAPHQPRLDWQMWFAALGSARRTPWFSRFMARLLEGAPEVTALLEHNPFPERPPKYVRALMYDYHYTDLETRRDEGLWWTREEMGLYFGPVALRER